MITSNQAETNSLELNGNRGRPGCRADAPGLQAASPVTASAVGTSAVNSVRIPLYVWMLVVAVVLLCCGARGARAAEPISIQISEEQFRGWLAYHGIEPGEAETHDAALLAAAVDLELARQQEANGLSRKLARSISWAEAGLLDRTLKRAMIEAVAVSPERVEELYQKRAESLGARPDTLLLHIISKRLPRESPERHQEIRTAVDTLRQRVVNGANFAALARTESESQTRFQGGRIGKVRMDRLPEQTKAVVESLQPGELSPVFSTGSSVQFLLLEERTEAKVPAGLRQRVESQEKERIRAQRWRDFLPHLQAFIPVQDCQDPEEVCLIADGLDWTRRDIETVLGEAAFTENPLVIDRMAETFASARFATALGIKNTRGVNGARVGMLLDWLRVKFLAAEQERLLVSALFEVPQEDEVRAEYRRLSAAGDPVVEIPQRHLLSMLVLAVPEDRLAATYQRMLELRETLSRDSSGWQVPDSFQPLGVEVATERWFSKRAVAGMGPRVLRELENLEEGEVSALIEDAVGVRRDRVLRLFRLHRTEPKRRATYAEARAQVEQSMVQTRLRELQDAVRNRVGEQLVVELIPAGTPAD